MRLFRICPDLRGHSRGNPRSGLIFMGGEGSGYHKMCVLCHTITDHCLYMYTQGPHGSLKSLKVFKNMKSMKSL